MLFLHVLDACACTGLSEPVILFPLISDGCCAQSVKLLDTISTRFYSHASRTHARTLDQLPEQVRLIPTRPRRTPRTLTLSLVCIEDILFPYVLVLCMV